MPKSVISLGIEAPMAAGVAGASPYCQLFLLAQKAFFTLHFAKEVENSWGMREISLTNIQALYRCAAEMGEYCTLQEEASPGLHVLFDATRVMAPADSLSEELKALKGESPRKCRTGGRSTVSPIRRVYWAFCPWLVFNILTYIVRFTALSAVKRTITVCAYWDRR